MLKILLLKAAKIITALAALNFSVVVFGYGMTLPFWAMYVILVSSVISLFSSAMCLFSCCSSSSMLGMCDKCPCNNKSNCK